jgi:CPA1 family monovalent cation:H+ antiporter
LAAEHFGFSGVLATMTAGIMLGNLCSLGAVSDKSHDMVESFWEYLGFVANSLIFLLIGIRLGYQRFEAAMPAIGVVIALMLAGRALAVYPCCAVFRWSSHRVPASDQHLLFWGGLRGALALALVLGLPEDTPSRQVIVTVVFAAVAFSILAQGLTIGPLMRRLRVGAV